VSRPRALDGDGPTRPHPGDDDDHLARTIAAELRHGVRTVVDGTTWYDLARGGVVALVWFGVLEVVARTSSWFAASGAVGGLRVAGVFLVVVAVSCCVPTAVFWVTAVFLPLSVLHHPYPDLLVVPLLVAAYRAAVAGRGPVALLGGVSVASAAVLSVGVDRLHQLPSALADLVRTGDAGWLDLSGTVVRLLVTFLVVAAGFLVFRLDLARGVLAERDAQLLTAHDEHAEAEVRAERTRIARELHDVVAHHISGIVLRAEAADLVADADPDEPRRSVRAIADAGREALDAVRSVVRMLRDPHDAEVAAHVATTSEPTAWHPTDTMAELPAVVARVAAAGLRVDAHLPDPLPRLGAAAELAVVRVAAEALTNVLLHSQATRAELWLDVTDDRVQLGIADPGPPAEDDGSSGGHGLMHMRERAASAAGTLDAGPDWPGWLVVLEVPVTAPPEHAPTELDLPAGDDAPPDIPVPDDETEEP